MTSVQKHQNTYMKDFLELHQRLHTTIVTNTSQLAADKNHYRRAIQKQHAK